MTTLPLAIAFCPQCQTQLAPGVLVCPGCGRLVHADELTALAQTARAASEQGDFPAALAAWRQALEMLPTGSRQYEVISTKIAELTRDLPPGFIPATRPADQKSGKAQSPGSKIAAGASVIGLMAWKLKVLLLGLTKGSTFLSMLLSLGIYWTLWGWKFALGFVLSIYIHEMGHVIALRRLGFKATAPMFIPGLGALIRLKQRVDNPNDDAEIGLAGPIYGLGAAIAALALWWMTGQKIFAAIAGVGAWINLFNLLPLGPLDGGRGFHAMSRLQKLLATLAVGAAWYYTKTFYAQDGLLLIVGLVCLGRAIADRSEAKGSWKATLTYAVLIVSLTRISVVRLAAQM